MGNDPNRGAYPDFPRLAVGAAVFKEDKVLLVRRAKPPAMGYWAIPGGSVELGETLQEAAEREILEETGIRIRAKEPFYTFQVIDRDEKDRVRYHYVIVDLTAEYVEGEPEPGDDASGARWFSRRDLNKHRVYPRTAKVLDSFFGFNGEPGELPGDLDAWGGEVA